MPLPIRYTDEFIKDLANKLIIWIQDPSHYWLGEFAAENKIPRQVLSELVGRDKDYDEAYHYAKSYQETKLATGALTGKFNSFFAFNALKNVAGWRDTKDMKHSGIPEKQDRIFIINGSSPVRRPPDRINAEAKASIS